MHDRPIDSMDDGTANRSPGEGVRPGPVRLLLVGAGGAEDRWSAALEGEGKLACRIAVAENLREVRNRLRDPLDGIVTWDDGNGELAAAVTAEARASGPPVPVLVVAHPRAPEGAVRALAGGAAGVLDRKHPERLPAAVRRVLRESALLAREALAGRIAHELNNSLAPVPLAARLLRRSATRPNAAAALEGQVDAIEQASRASMESVRKLSELLVAEEDAPLRVRAKHLLAIAAEGWRDVPGRSADVLVEYPADLPDVRVVVRRSLQVLACLARRARDRAGGELLFLGREDGAGSVELAVGCRPAGTPGPVERPVERPDPGAWDARPAGAEDGVSDVLRAVEEDWGTLRRIEARGGWAGFAVVLPRAREPGRGDV
ncbi:MAG: hypothetical protein ACLF0P_14430 [Thermoanaerobaculia bacterium]